MPWHAMLLLMSSTSFLPMQAKEIPQSQFDDPIKVFVRGRNFRGSNFRETNLIGVIFKGSNLRSADFRFCFAPCANFNAAHLKSAIFKGANLHFASFVDANLRCANFCAANLSKAHWDENTVWPNGIGRIKNTLEES